MALDTVVFPQDPFTYNGGKDLYNLLGLNWNSNYDFSLGKEDDQSLNFLGNQTELSNYGEWSSTSSTPNSMLPHFNEVLHLSNIPPSSDNNINPTNDSSESSQQQQQQFDSSTSATASARPKRRRSKSRKNKEEIENQRMTHIAVERNRRKQMNEYLAVLRSLMPDSYVQRGDQASIIGGAINFVKELEQQVQFLGAQKEINDNSDGGGGGGGGGGGSVCRSMPFSEFFTFPQYSTSSSHCENSVAMVEPLGKNKSAIADVEVTMVESHANVKIRSKRRSKQLLKIVSGLHTLRLSILHLNVTTADETALYSLSVKVEDDCNLNSVDEIAGAVYQMLASIQEEAMLNN